MDSKEEKYTPPRSKSPSGRLGNSVANIAVNERKQIRYTLSHKFVHRSARDKNQKRRELKYVQIYLSASLAITSFLAYFVASEMNSKIIITQSLYVFEYFRVEIPSI